MSKGVVCNGLGNGYGCVTVVHGVDLELRREGALAVVGENACKATVMKIQAGIVQRVLGPCYPSPRRAYDAAKLSCPRPCNGGPSNEHFNSDQKVWAIARGPILNHRTQTHHPADIFGEAWS